METEIKFYKRTFLPDALEPNSLYFIKPLLSTTVRLYVTNINGNPFEISAAYAVDIEAREDIQQILLDLANKIDIDQIGVPGGVVPLGLNGLIDPAYLPSGANTTHKIYRHTVTAQNIIDKTFVLPDLISDLDSVQTFVIGGTLMVLNFDYLISALDFSWAGKALDGVLRENDVIEVSYNLTM